MDFNVRFPIGFSRGHKRKNQYAPRTNKNKKSPVKKAAENHAVHIMSHGTPAQQMAIMAKELELGDIPTANLDEELERDLIANSFQTDESFKQQMRELYVMERHQKIQDKYSQGGGGYNGQQHNWEGGYPDGFDGFGGQTSALSEMADNMEAMEKIAEKMGYGGKKSWFDGEVAAAAINAISQAFGAFKNSGNNGNGNQEMIMVMTDQGPRKMTTDAADRYMQLQENRKKALPAAQQQGIQSDPATQVHMQNNTVQTQPTPEQPVVNNETPTSEVQIGAQVEQPPTVDTAAESATGEQPIYEPPVDSRSIPDISIASWAPYLDDTDPDKFADLMMKNLVIHQVMSGEEVTTHEGIITREFLDFFVSNEPDIILGTLEKAKEQANAAGDYDTLDTLERLTSDKREWVLRLFARLQEIYKDMTDEEG